MLASTFSRFASSAHSIQSGGIGYRAGLTVDQLRAADGHKPATIETIGATLRAIGYRLGITGTHGNIGTRGNSEPMGISDYYRMADRIIQKMAPVDKFDYLSDYADEPAHDIGTGSLHWALLTDIARTGPAVFCERLREDYDE